MNTSHSEMWSSSSITTGDAGFLDTAISGILIPLYLCTSPSLIPLLSLSSWNPAAFSSWSPEKCWITYSSPNVLLDHFDFFGLFATSLYLDNTTSHASSSRCDCFTLILPRSLDLSGMQTLPSSNWCCYPISSSFLKTLNSDSYNTRLYQPLTLIAFITAKLLIPSHVLNI